MDCADNAPTALPQAQPIELAKGITLQAPLSRRGHGPGLILVMPPETPEYPQSGTLCVDGVPPPLLKWAEEGFAVVQINHSVFDTAATATEVVGIAVAGLESCDKCCDGEGIGLIVYDNAKWNVILALPHVKIVASVVFTSASDPELETAPIPALQHIAGQKGPKYNNGKGLTRYSYPSVQSSLFAIPCLTEFDYTTEAVAHTRTLTFFKQYIRGADFDLEAIWEEHTYYEFGDRSVEKTMATMVQEPYVNHIPTMTGGIGRERLSSFYRHHFIFSNPTDTELELVSRTIGIDRICDEFIFKLTHDREIDWLLPGLPPTGRRIEIPFTSIVNVRGDRLYHEHIAWDQASILMQLGLLPEYLPFPYPVPESAGFEAGRALEYRVPAAGVETATKMRDKGAVPSNGMFDYRIREAPS